MKRAISGLGSLLLPAARVTRPLTLPPLRGSLPLLRSSTSHPQVERAEKRPKARLFIPAFLACAVLLSGCQKPASTDITLSKPPVFLKGAMSPFELQVKNGTEPGAGYAVSAKFSMSRMDHGTLDIKLAEMSPGTYRGEIPLPMGGDWDVDATATKDGKTVQKALSFKAVDGG